MASSLTKGTVRVQIRKDTASNWTSTNPTLASGEFGFETDTGYVKIGDGSTAWTTLRYIAEWQLIDGDGTTVEMNTGHTLTLTEGTGIDINHTDTSGDAFATTITCDLRGEELSSALTAGGNATDGHILTATGSGTAAWEAAAGGGDTNTFAIGPIGGRIGSINNDTNFWTCGSYGLNYTFWTSNNQLADRDHGASDTYEYQMALRVVHIPYACTLKGFSGTYYTAASSTQYLIEWWKASPSYPTSTVSDLVFSDISINVTTSGASNYQMQQISKTDGSVSLSAGDVLTPYISRASGSGSGYVYLMMSLIFEKS